MTFTPLVPTKRRALRRGIAYPLTVTANGRLLLHEDLDLLRDRIIAVLETRPFEMVLRPGFGTPNFVFEAGINPGLIIENIRQQLETQITEVDDWNIGGVMTDDGAMLISIQWVVYALPQPPIRYRITL
jgi:hypothetical protein